MPSVGEQSSRTQANPPFPPGSSSSPTNELLSWLDSCLPSVQGPHGLDEAVLLKPTLRPDRLADASVREILNPVLQEERGVLIWEPATTLGVRDDGHGHPPPAPRAGAGRLEQGGSPMMRPLPRARPPCHPCILLQVFRQCLGEAGPRHGHQSSTRTLSERKRLPVGILQKSGICHNHFI